MSIIIIIIIPVLFNPPLYPSVGVWRVSFYVALRSADRHLCLLLLAHSDGRPASKKDDQGSRKQPRCSHPSTLETKRPEER